MLETQACKEIERTDGEARGYIGGGNQMVAVVMIAQMGIVDKVEALVAVVGGLHELVGHVHIAEIGGQETGTASVPSVDKTAGAIGTRAVFAIKTREEFDIVAAAQLQAHIASGRKDVLIEASELAADIVARGQSDAVGIKGVVEGVAAAVGQEAVGVGVACIPVPTTAVENVFTRELGVVGRARTIIVFGTANLVALRVEALALGVSLLAELVDNVLPFVASIALCRHPSEVKEAAETGIVAVLSVGALAQIHTGIMLKVVGAIEGVGHGRIGAVGVAVIERGQQRKHTAALTAPRAIDIGRKSEVGPRMATFHLPIVIESIAQEVDASAREGAQRSRQTAWQTATAIVETEEIGCAGSIHEEGLCMRAVVHSTAD